MEKMQKQVWDVVLKFARAWATDRDPEKLRDVFHESMVSISPMRRERVEGRDANIAEYEAYLARATVLDWKLTDENIQLYGNQDAAVVTYYYDMNIQIDTEIHRAQGRDMLVLIREDGKWWVVADQFSSFPRD